MLLLGLGMMTLQSRHQHKWQHPRKWSETSFSPKVLKVYLGEDNPQYKATFQSFI